MSSPRASLRRDVRVIDGGMARANEPQPEHGH